MRILLALAVMMLVATPAFAGHKNNNNKLDRKIAGLNEKIGEIVTTPSDDRREQLDKFERKLGYALFKRNQKDDR